MGPFSCVDDPTFLQSEDALRLKEAKSYYQTQVKTIFALDLGASECEEELCTDPSYHHAHTKAESKGAPLEPDWNKAVASGGWYCYSCHNDCEVTETFACKKCDAHTVLELDEAVCIGHYPGGSSNNNCLFCNQNPCVCDNCPFCGNPFCMGECLGLPPGGSTGQGTSTPKLYIDASTSLTLGESYELSFDLDFPSSMQTIPAHSIHYYISGTNLPSTVELTATHALAPGVFYIYAMCHFDYQAMPSITSSNTLQITVQYPDAYLIQSATESEMNLLWTITKDAAAPGSRTEFGFWIYCITAASPADITRGGQMSGNPVSTCLYTSASIDPGAMVDSPGNVNSGGSYAVAFFHTHPPLTYCPYNSFRLVGPSSTDISLHSQKGISGFVYDYMPVTEDGRTGAFGCHNIDNPATISIINPDRRSL